MTQIKKRGINHRLHRFHRFDWVWGAGGFTRGLRVHFSATADVMEPNRCGSVGVTTFLSCNLWNLCNLWFHGFAL
jgi:hypothetical protein